MTKPFIFYKHLIRVMQSYADCLIDLTEATEQLVDSHRWVYGVEPIMKDLVTKFERKELQAFIALCSNTL